jgi:predicted TIM-barrel fold metal-dependent hydrolase
MHRPHGAREARHDQDIDLSGYCRRIVEEAQRRQILVDNPGRLYGFPPPA